MQTINLLYKREYPINKYISVAIPTVGEIIDNEDEYYNLVSIFTAMPIDMMAQLDDIGIDFTSINEYDLFLLMFEDLKQKDTHLLFGDLDLSQFGFFKNNQNNTIMLMDKEKHIRIDRAIHGQIAAVLREIHHIKQDRRRPANDDAKAYMLQRAHEKALRNKRRQKTSQLEALITSLVNTEQYKYDFEGTRELSIYQFNECVRQIAKKIDYEHLMHGIYAGTVDPKNYQQEQLSWLSVK